MKTLLVLFTIMSSPALTTWARAETVDEPMDASTEPAPTSQGSDAPTSSDEETAGHGDGARPGFGLWVGGLVTGLVGFGAGIAGMALFFSDDCESGSCSPWVGLMVAGVAAFITGIVLVTVGRRRMRRARALPEFMRRGGGALFFAQGPSLTPQGPSLTQP